MGQGVRSVGSFQRVPRRRRAQWLDARLRPVRAVGRARRRARPKPVPRGLSAELLALLSLLARLRLRRGSVRGLQARCGGDEDRLGRPSGRGLSRQPDRPRLADRHCRRHPAERPGGGGARHRPDLLRARGGRPAAAADHRISLFADRPSDDRGKPGGLRRHPDQPGVPAALVAAGGPACRPEYRAAGDGAGRSAARPRLRARQRPRPRRRPVRRGGRGAGIRQASDAVDHATLPAVAGRLRLGSVSLLCGPQQTTRRTP